MTVICRRFEEMDKLIPYVDKPVYVRGYCWGKRFDGWTVIYFGEHNNLMFDYRGESYSVRWFLPRFALPTSSTYNNAIYFEEE